MSSRSKPGDCQTNVCSMMPEMLADVISEVLKSKNFPCFAQIITYLADMCLLSLD